MTNHSDAGDQHTGLHQNRKVVIYLVC